MHWQLLHELSDADRRLVLASAQSRRFARGEILFHEGDPADTVHFIAEGRVMARRTTEAGDSVAFRVIGRGRALGDVSVSSSHARRTSTIVALESTTTLSIGFEEFRRLCAAHPGIQHHLATLLSARVRRLSDQLMDALFLPSDRRVVRRVLDLCGQYAESSDQQVLIPLTQADIAELSGATRSTANRVLRALQSDGLIRLARGRVIVLDREALRRRDGCAPKRG